MRDLTQRKRPSPTQVEWIIENEAMPDVGLTMLRGFRRRRTLTTLGLRPPIVSAVAIGL
jgi:hypothetical protein